MTELESVVEREFSFAKAASTINEVWHRALPLPSGGSLVPLSRLHLEDDELLAALGQWRSENAAAYTNRFEITPARTRRWLAEAVLARPDRLMLLVVQANGAVVGHVGLANGLGREAALEIDNVLRGKRPSDKGLFSEAVREAMNWARRVLFIRDFYLRVLASNENATAFYRRLGFTVAQKLPLKWTETENGERHLVQCQGPDCDDEYLVMEHQPEPHDADTLILTAGPSIGMRETAYVADAVRSGWNQNWNHDLLLLESDFATRIGCGHAISTSSCTGALHIALASLGIGPGDEVIVPELTWVATANAVRYVGATPVFADVDDDTWLLTAETASRCLSPRTKAIIPVHLYGFPCDMPSLMRFAGEHDLYVIEDAAAALGAQFDGKPVGSFGHFAAFSFQGAKVTVAGEGGMLLTSDEALFQAARKIADQGRRPGGFWIDGHGLKYKLSNVQAALARAQVSRIDELILAKQRIYERYCERLRGLAKGDFYRAPEGQASAYWMNSLRLHEDAPFSRDELIRELKARNIDTRPVFPAISQYPIWPSHRPAAPVAKAIGDSALNLPSGVCLTAATLDYICAALTDLLA